MCPWSGGGQIRLLPEGDELEGLYAELTSGDCRSLFKVTPAHLDVLGERLRLSGATNVVAP